MLIPRFSLRQLLALTTASALFCYVIAMAARGHQWAIAISLAISSVLLGLVVHAVVFVMAWLLTLLGRQVTRPVVLLIRLYQAHLSPLIRSRQCRFSPSCSEYAIQAIQKYGLLHGGLLAYRRIRRCNPSHEGGHDPVA